MLNLATEFNTNFKLGHYFFIDLGRWYFSLDILDSSFCFCFDSLSIMSSFLVLVLSCLALYFGSEYMFREYFLNRLFYLLNMFAVSVIMLFFSYDFFLIILSWECIGLFSFLLVNFYLTRVYTIKAAMKTFVFSRVSDLFMFFSFVLILFLFSSSDLSFIFIQIPFISFNYLSVYGFSVHILSLLACSISLTGAIKSAQFFFHVWLPDAMEAPTPASALIHSSTLVVAGVFLILRFSILFEFSIIANYLLLFLGSITLGFASLIAIFQHDIKKLVAYSTISQIGYLVCGCGLNCFEETFLYLITHALNKAFLFILVGYTVHFFNHNTDMRQMGGFYLYSFEILVLFFGVSINLSGLPYSAGFVSKEFLLFQLFKNSGLIVFIKIMWITAFFCTPIYMLTLIFLVNFSIKKGIFSSYNLNNFKNFNLYNESHFIYKLNLLSQKYFNISKTTSIVLAIFWLFFFSWGESFLLFLFNFSSINNSISTNFFLRVTNAPFFSIDQYTSFFIESLSLTVLSLFLLALGFLMFLNYKNIYNFFKSYNLFIFFLFVLYLSL